MMRKILFLLIPVSGLFLFFTCEEVETKTGNDVFNNELIGKWQFFERGYSPGAGYVTEQIDPSPLQWISFQSDNQFDSNIESLDSFNFYYILDGPKDGKKVLALFVNKQDPEMIKLEGLGHSYYINWEGEVLKLNFRFCIEGCHMAFIKIKGESNI